MREDGGTDEHDEANSRFWRLKANAPEKLSNGPGGVPQAFSRSAIYQIIARSKTPISTSAIFTHHFNALSKVSLKFNVYNL